MIFFKVCSPFIVYCHSWVEAELTGLNELSRLHVGQGLLHTCSAISLKCMSLFAQYHKLLVWQRVCEVFHILYNSIFTRNLICVCVNKVLILQIKTKVQMSHILFQLSIQRVSKQLNCIPHVRTEGGPEAFECYQEFPGTSSAPLSKHQETQSMIFQIS